jgi:hypothetical protein
MTIADWLMISSVLSGPIIAVQLTRFLDDRREIRNRKLQIFKTLMATRAYTVSWSHVEALNRIDLEFDKQEKKELAVIEAWKAYLDLLNNNDKISPDQWGVKRIDLFVDLLHKMAIVLDYTFDKTHIKNSSYAPIAHANMEGQQETIRKEAIELLEGKRSLSIRMANLSDDIK